MDEALVTHHQLPSGEAESMLDDSAENYSDSGDEVPPCTTSTTTDSTSASPPTGAVHDIRCGLLHAKLHMERFICPGIHRRCVEFDGAMITPRQFTIKAEKDKQKDWKGSIRLGRHNLRTLMEMKTLDFFDHASNCSLKCQSRNYIKNRRNDGTGDMFPPPSSSIEESISEVVHTSIASAATVTTCNSHRKASSSALEDYVMRTVQPINGNVALANLAALMNNGSPAVGNPQPTPAPMGEQVFALRSPSALAHQMSGNGSSAPSHHTTPEKMQQRNVNSSIGVTPAGDAALLSAVLQMLLMEQQQQLPKVETMGEHQAFGGGAKGPTTNNNNNATFDGWMSGFRREIRRLMETQPVAFWSQMRELGICEDLLATLCATIDQLRQLYLGGGAEDFAAQKLSQLSALLDLDLLYAEKILNRHAKTTMGGAGVESAPSGLQVPERKLNHRDTRNGSEKTVRKSLLDEILYGCTAPHYRTPQAMNYD